MRGCHVETLGAGPYRLSRAPQRGLTIEDLHLAIERGQETPIRRWNVNRLPQLGPSPIPALVLTPTLGTLGPI